jgi:hypothetical protein
MATPRSSDLPRPKAFVSYSHSSSEYDERVLDLAAALANHGVDLVFDQWDLREGQDLYAFMEQAMNDPTVSHVLILCDPMYAEKANERQGGVGTETLIISPSVYRDVQQKRVIPVIMGRDEQDRVLVPTYLDGRFYIDLSTEERMAENYEQLVRALFNRPSRQRPPLGQPPTFLAEDYVPLQTSGAARVARTSVIGQRADAPGRFGDYLDRLIASFLAEDIREPSGDRDTLVDQLFESLDRFRPYEEEFIGVLRDVARYGGDHPELYDRLHSFFERVASARFQHEDRRFANGWETENLAFLGWELMLDATAVLLGQDQFGGLGRLMRPLYVSSRLEAGALRSLEILEPSLELIPWGYGQRKQQDYRDGAATLLRDRHQNGQIPFDQVMEADLLMWYRTKTDPEIPGWWSPRTLMYAEYRRHLPLFLRAQSAVQFARLVPALGVRDRADFVRSFVAISERELPMVGGRQYGRGFYQGLLGIRPDET